VSQMRPLATLHTINDFIYILIH